MSTMTHCVLGVGRFSKSLFFGRNVFLLKTCAHLRVLSFCVSMIAILMRKLGYENLVSWLR